MSGNFIDRADKFIETYRSLLIAIAIALGLFNMYQNHQANQVRWVEGWDCQYWDAQRNSYQSLIESELSDPSNPGDLYSFTKKRDEAGEKFNRNCLPEFGYFVKP